MKSVMIVDDEPLALDGLRMRLRPMARQWQMSFADSGAAALERLAEEPHDVVISDLRMPGIDGAQLLRAVSERWPQTFRIVLSGQAEMHQALRLVPVAHQFISKPCPPKHLENVVERGLQLQSLLQQPELRAVVGSIKRLPAIPQTFARLQAAMTRESATITEVAGIVSQDAGLAAKVLQVVNSAFFRLPRRVTSIQQAISYLGFTAIRNLVMSAEVFSAWSGDEAHSFLDLGELQTRSLRVAEIVHGLARGQGFAEDALLAALVHDIGYWLLLQERRADLERAFALATAESLPLHEAERRVLGASHAEIGAYLLGMWGLPYPIVEAVAHHHLPERVEHPCFDATAALAIANELADVEAAHPSRAAVAVDWRLREDYLVRIDAPFDWDEARRRAAKHDALETS